jgi:hypothetical protein
MPVHRVKPHSYRANPFRQGHLKFWKQDSTRTHLTAWEAVPEMEAFGVDRTNALPVPWSDEGITWWTHTEPSFSLATETNLDMKNIDDTHFYINGKIYEIPKGSPEPDMRRSARDLSAAIQAVFRDLINRDAEVDHVSRDVIEGLLFVLMMNRDGDILVWGLLEPGTSLFRGAGKIIYYKQAGECLVSSASLEDSLQGRGVYQRVVKYISKVTGAKIYSDNSMSLKATLAWAKMGELAVAKATPGTRFKLRNNPRRQRSLYSKILLETILTSAST